MQHFDEEWRADRVFIVTGPPGAGKTTYCRKNMQPGDICLDLDYLCAALSLSEPWQNNSGTIRTAKAVFDFLVDGIDAGSLTYGRAFIITTRHAEQIQERTGGRIVRIDPGIETVLRQIGADQRGDDDSRKRRKDAALKYYYSRGRE